MILCKSLIIGVQMERSANKGIERKRDRKKLNKANHDMIISIILDIKEEKCILSNADKTLNMKCAVHHIKTYLGSFLSVYVMISCIMMIWRMSFPS